MPAEPRKASGLGCHGKRPKPPPTIACPSRRSAENDCGAYGGQRRKKEAVDEEKENKTEAASKLSRGDESFRPYRKR